MSPAQLHMSTPPAGSEDPSAFEKLPGSRAQAVRHASRHTSRGPQNEAYDADESRRGQWLLATVVITLLVIGGLLIFSGLL